MNVVQKALMGFMENGTPTNICIQGTVLHLDQILGLSEKTLCCQIQGRPWIFDMDLVSGISSDQIQETSVGTQAEAVPDQPQWKRLFLSGEAPVSDPESLASLVNEVEMPPFTQSESMWAQLKDHFHQNPACLNEIDKIFDLVDEIQEGKNTPQLRTRVLNYIEGAKDAFPQSQEIFECLRAKALLCMGESFEAASALFFAGRLGESLSILYHLRTPKTEKLFQCMLGGQLIATYGGTLTCFDQKLVLIYARLCKFPQEVGLFAALLRDGRHGREVDPAYLGAVIALIQEKKPSYTPSLPLDSYALAKDLMKAWDLSNGPAPDEYYAVRQDGIDRWRALEIGDGKRGFEELDGRTFFQSDVDSRFGSYAGYYQYWLSFQSDAQRKNSMYLNPHQIIDPLLSKCLTWLSIQEVQHLKVQFVAGENTTRVAATCAFLAAESRERALTALASRMATGQRNSLSYHLDFFNLQKTKDEEMLRIFDKESVEKHRIADPQAARKDAQVFLFLQAVLADPIMKRSLPEAWEDQEELAKCANHLLAGGSLAPRHLWLGRLIYWLRRSGHQGHDLLVKGFCHGLPQEHPFHYPLGNGRSKEAIFSDCLSQMGQLRFLEAMDGFREWGPKMLQKHRVDHPDKLRNASHQTQYALAQVLLAYCEAVLEGEPGQIVKAQEDILSQKGLTLSMREKLQAVFTLLKNCEW